MSIDMKGLDELDRRFAEALKERPELRKQMHEEVALALQTEVRGQMAKTGIARRTGRLEGWQKNYVGTGGGYAAVRAIGKADGGGTGPNSAGAITNYLESGHKVRPPSGKAKRPRKSRRKKAFVTGRYFYAAARGQAQQVALAAANRYAERIAERIGD